MVGVAGLDIVADDGKARLDVDRAIQAGDCMALGGPVWLDFAWKGVEGIVFEADDAVAGLVVGRVVGAEDTTSSEASLVLFDGVEGVVGLGGGGGGAAIDGAGGGAEDDADEDASAVGGAVHTEDDDDKELDEVDEDADGVPATTRNNLFVAAFSLPLFILAAISV